MTGEDSGWLQGKIKQAFSAVRLFKIGADRTLQPVWHISRDTFASATSSARALELIEAQMVRVFGSTKPELAQWHLSIPPIGPNGFAIDVSSREGEIRALFGELEEEFANFTQAMIWVERALSRSYRLQITLVGEIPTEWRLEPVVPGPQPESLAYGHVVWFRRAKKTRVITRQNAFPA